MIRSITGGIVTAVATALIALSAAPAEAQLNGENLLGDTGVKNGTQPAPGRGNTPRRTMHGTSVHSLSMICQL